MEKGARLPMVLWWCLLHALYASCQVTASPGPQQIHIAIGGVDSAGMAISWVSDAKGTSVVKYGQSNSSLDQRTESTTRASQYSFCLYTSGYMHHVLLEDLSPSETYYYVVGGDAYGWSSVLSFQTPPKRGDLNAPLTFGILGDMGQTKYSEETLGSIRSHEHSLNAVLLAGDLSYADTVQSRWDSWGTLVEPSTSTIPWMMAAGNHEIEISCRLSTFDAYQARYRMPFAESGAPRGNLFYSFDVGSVHVVVLTPYIPTASASDQYKWLARDLNAVDRARTPWIIVMMHGPWYSSNRAHQNKIEPQHAMRRDMEDLLFDHRVHLVLAGHVHSYERTLPVYKNDLTVNAPIYITIGDGGNREGLADKYITPQPTWSAFREARYGYGLLHVKNHSHMLFEWHEDETNEAKVRDSVWIHHTAKRKQHE
ncbi:Aste57867_24825 [Aphanomyces stellatus]|uniref:Purple acid phosphatase n=1 Tax=Aphanomyces stellatus TaxID=120398 RepID=A0A485LRJ2_9STRA|nr:hypothetical protein As57867_024747 [Aphanomyces stellatus]VFU01460.1 Aste57867_24825 [Aphanomyces stellatus]